MRLTARFLVGATFLSCLLSSPVHAESRSYGNSTYAVLDTGITRGGDKLLDAHFFFGGRESIHAGDAYFVDFGVGHDFEGSNWSYKITGGYAFAEVGSFWSSRAFKRFPLDAIAVYNIGRNQIGFGLTYHFNPQLDMNGHGTDVRFHDAPGAILQYQYWLFGVRYTYVRYRPKDVPGASTLDGSSLGLFVSIPFGR